MRPPPSIIPRRLTWTLVVTDMRQYYFTNTDMGDGTLKSELILLRTNLDDNGTFQCVAENRAGVAVANFTLNVVVPVPPKPPQAQMNILHLKKGS